MRGTQSCKAPSRARTPHPLLSLSTGQEHYEAEKRKADARADFESEQAYLKTLSLFRCVGRAGLQCYYVERSECVW